ncbi:hypothetical protein [Spirosoma panaciterrae]|uniref:hypothetical protein n=1 Tax=Spirosoma panaciterrae TaxID=496058 RepID=UPI00036C39C2|nr:hypothetical protein [Spirosoma panaciterrae]
MSALQDIRQLVDARKTALKPNFPTRCIPRSKYNDKDANVLTRCVVGYFNLSGYFATRLQPTETYHEDINWYIPSQQGIGLPDLLYIVNGCAVVVEIKIGKDRPPEVQK